MEANFASCFKNTEKIEKIDIFEVLWFFYVLLLCTDRLRLTELTAKSAKWFAAAASTIKSDPKDLPEVA